MKAIADSLSILEAADGYALAAEWLPEMQVALGCVWDGERLLPAPITRKGASITCRREQLTITDRIAADGESIAVRRTWDFHVAGQVGLNFEVAHGMELRRWGFLSDLPEAMEAADEDSPDEETTEAISETEDACSRPGAMALTAADATWWVTFSPPEADGHCGEAVITPQSVALTMPAPERGEFLAIAPGARLVRTMTLCRLPVESMATFLRETFPEGPPKPPPWTATLAKGIGFARHGLLVRRGEALGIQSEVRPNLLPVRNVLVSGPSLQLAAVFARIGKEHGAKAYAEIGETLAAFHCPPPESRRTGLQFASEKWLDGDGGELLEVALALAACIKAWGGDADPAWQESLGGLRDHVNEALADAEDAHILAGLVRLNLPSDEALALELADRWPADPAGTPPTVACQWLLATLELYRQARQSEHLDLAVAIGTALLQNVWTSNLPFKGTAISTRGGLSEAETFSAATSAQAALALMRLGRWSRDDFWYRVARECLRFALQFQARQEGKAATLSLRAHHQGPSRGQAVKSLRGAEVATWLQSLVTLRDEFPQEMPGALPLPERLTPGEWQHQARMLISRIAWR